MSEPANWADEEWRHCALHAEPVEGDTYDEAAEYEPPAPPPDDDWEG